MIPKRKKIAGALPADDAREEDIAVHVFSVSAAMIGVCLTTIGIVRLIVTSTKNETLADDVLSVATVFFFLACALSYGALRARRRKRFYALEKAADMFFLVGLCMMGIVSFIITYMTIF